MCALRAVLAQSGPLARADLIRQTARRLGCVRVWEKMNKHRFDNILLKTKTVGAQATPEGIQVQFEGLDGTKSEGTYDLVLQAVGRTPNGKKIAADKAGVAVTDRGFINVDIQMRTNVPHIFAIGDIVGQPMLAHKAVHEAHVAAEVIAGRTAKQQGAGQRCLQRPRHPQRGLHRPRSGLGGLDRRPGQGARHQGQEGPVPLDGIRPRHCQRPRRRLHQAAV
jgi:pyruvate/2-oxoglutarate dehydrogenase complex dihydrolipoamide acyltransferase (E2) component